MHKSLFFVFTHLTQKQNILLCYVHNISKGKKRLINIQHTYTDLLFYDFQSNEDASAIENISESTNPLAANTPNQEDKKKKMTDLGLKYLSSIKIVGIRRQNLIKIFMLN
jgi:hypothetical protein